MIKGLLPSRKKDANILSYGVSCAVSGWKCGLLDLRTTFILAKTLLIALAGMGLTPVPASATECAGAPSTNKIVHFGNARSSQWPWFATLRLNHMVDRTETYFCGATVIHKQWLLTAAHCIRDMGIFRRQSGDFVSSDGRTLEAIIGVDDLNAIPASRVFEVVNVIVHPQY